MKLSDFDYNLPPEFIAQVPVEPRHNSKLMIAHKDTGKIEHKFFYNIIDYLDKDDILVANNTKVMAARLFGKKKGTGAKVEILLLHQEDKLRWKALVKPSRRLKKRDLIIIGDDYKIEGKIIDDLGEGIRIIEFKRDIMKVLDKIGIVPLPPYIKESKIKESYVPAGRYQTVYAKSIGSAAAPTAGLHFTPELMLNLRNKGISFKFVSLNIGLDTFRPIKTDDILNHKMHSEYCQINKKTALELNKAQKEEKRIIAVGTTAVRVLETAYDKKEGFKSFNGWTDIFIYPGYKFNAVDGLITNFHLPKSTLLLLVSAFAEREFILKAYEEAKNNNYRFFSFGDAMMII